MRAVMVRQHGGPEALLFEDIPEPAPAAGEVLIEVRAVALNHLDLWVRRGVPGHSYPLPLIPGCDMAGVVRTLGAGTQGLTPGDEVVIAPGVSCGVCVACHAGRDHACKSYGILGETRHGGCAELAVVPRVNVFAKPATLSFAESAALGVPFLTAWHMLTARAQLALGETVLVLAGGSGVGVAAIQIAKLHHATVITTVGSAAKAERAKLLGAQHVLDSSRQDVAKEVKAITGGRGVDVVFEHVGAATWTASLRSLAWHGRLVTCGATTGADVQVNLRHLFFKAQSLLGSTMGSRGEYAAVLEHAALGRLKPVIDRVMPLSDLRAAHHLLEERQAFGRVVMTP